MRFVQNNETAFLDESASFVALAWQELFDPKTPYSYRPKLYDTHGLVEELSSLADLAIQDRRWVRHLELVKSELQVAAAAETCWLKEHTWSAGIIKKISDTTEIAQIKDLTTLFTSTSPNPVTQLFECLYRELGTLPKNKKKTLTVLKLLGTQAIRCGLTASGIGLNLPDIRHKNHMEIAHILQGLFEAKSRSFYCVVQLSGDPSHVHSLFAQNGFQKARKKDYPLDQIGQEFKKSISHNTVFRYEIEEISHVAAAAQAVQACRRVIDLFNLYQNRASIELDSNILVVDVDGGRNTIVSRHTEQSLATQPSRSARKLTREVLHSLRYDDLGSGLENSLEQHSLALSSSEPKASLVGIWTAFESLVGSDGRDPNIQRIVDRISPIVALRQVEKNTRYLAVCCHEYLKTVCKHPSQTFIRSSSYYFSPRDILDAITGPENNSLVVQLLRDTSNHPLLRFRIYQAWQDFHEPRTVKKNLLRSKQYLDWHIERIYRARNLTVHQGKTPPLVSELVDHAQHYFTRSMTRVLADLMEHPSWTTHTALENQRQRFHFVTANLDARAQEIPAQYLFPSDEEFLEYYPWKS